MPSMIEELVQIESYPGDRGCSGGYRVEIRIGGVRFVDQDGDGHNGGMFEAREDAEKRRQKILKAANKRRGEVMETAKVLGPGPAWVQTGWPASLTEKFEDRGVGGTVVEMTDEKIKRLEAENKELRERCAALKERCAALEAENAKCQERATQLQYNFDMLRHQVDELGKKARAIDAADDPLEEQARGHLEVVRFCDDSDVDE